MVRGQRVWRAIGEFKTHVLETIVGPVFNHIANTFVDAFVRRAAAVYAKAR